MDIVKYIGKSISQELSELVEEVLKHEQRREGESDRDYSNRYWSELPRRTYAQMPEEMKAWIDSYLPAESLKDFFLLMVSPDAEDMEKRLEDPEELSRTLEELQRHLTYTVRLHRIQHTENMDDMEIGLYADVTGADMLAAWAAMKAARVIQEATATQDPAAIDRVNVIPVDRLTYPLDKVNSKIWSLLETDTRGQLRIRAEKLGSKKEINILYSIDFDALGSNARITKKLTQFDKRVYIAVAGLFNAGNSVITLRQIHLAMGGTGRASANQRQKISAAVHKMHGAMISIDNAIEAGTYNYPKFVYTGSLLPIERIRKIVNGNVVEEAIHLFREPPAMTFARQRGQITTIPVRLLNSHVSMTDTNLAIEDYLLDRISHAKKGKGQSKILYRTICEKVGAVTVKRRQRVPEKVKEYLTHYVKCGYIASFAETSDGVTVAF